MHYYCYNSLLTGNTENESIQASTNNNSTGY